MSEHPSVQVAGAIHLQKKHEDRRWLSYAPQAMRTLLPCLFTLALMVPTVMFGKPKPNIVFVLADQLRASALGHRGDPNVRTPNLDRLASESLDFRNAVSVCPVCTPYRAALMTGRFPTATGMFLNDAYLPEEELCLAEVLKEAGYDTAYIGKWHLDGHGRDSYIPPERRQGFGHWQTAECDHKYPRSHYYSDNSDQKKFWDGYDAFDQTRHAQAYLRQRAGAEKPFFLMVSYGIPHFPHGTAPEELKELYPPEGIRFASNVPAAMQTAAIRKEAQGYYAHCTALDKCVGELLSSLESLGLAENTIFIFTSDHGEMMGSHGVPPATKQVWWAESASVPFLLRHPSVHGRRGRIVTTPLTTPDIMPTLLSLARIKIPRTVQGVDLSTAVRKSRNLEDHVALYMAVAPFAGEGLNIEYRAIRTASHSYIRTLNGMWLFDHRKDPFELTNLVDRIKAGDVRRELDRQWKSELKRIGDDFRPAAFYVGKFGFDLSPKGSISYAPGAPVQSPGRR